jgi:hypothetical protein
LNKALQEQDFEKSEQQKGQSVDLKQLLKSSDFIMKDTKISDQDKLTALYNILIRLTYENKRLSRDKHERF